LNAIKREWIGLSNGHSTGVVTAPVLIVGAGPVGMMAALLLARQGVRSVLIERRSELTAHPKGRGFNARSMELFRQCGMLADMVAAQPKTEQVQHVAMGTGIDDPDLKIMPFFGASQAVRELSPAPNVVGGQDIVEMVTVAHLRRFAAVTLIYDCELTAIAQDENGVSAVATRSDGSQVSLRADYVIAADGARSPVRRLTGRTMEQRSAVLNQNVNILFRADLSAYMDRFGTCAFLTIMGRERPGLRGILAIMSTVRSEDERTYNIVLGPDETPDMITMENAAEWVQREIGLPVDLPIEIKSISPWDASARLIDRFRDGRIFFAGDAARTIPPAGALGMNTGLIDANNAAWRIALAVRGFASDRFLEDYHVERYGHAEAIVAASVQNMQGAIMRGPPVPGATPPPGGNPPERPPQGSQTGLYLGFTYRSGSVIPDGSAPPEVADPRNDYVPSAIPGARAPHLWIDPRYDHSVLDLFGGGFVLLGSRGSDWLKAGERIAFETGFPIRAIDMHDECRTAAIWRDWMALYEVNEEGAVLVRPDGMVGWRSAAKADDADAQLRAAIGVIMGKDLEGNEQ
jgi:putative polyketide hydroxylase